MSVRCSRKRSFRGHTDIDLPINVLCSQPANRSVKGDTNNVVKSPPPFLLLFVSPKFGKYCLRDIIEPCPHAKKNQKNQRVLLTKRFRLVVGRKTRRFTDDRGRERESQFSRQMPTNKALKQKTTLTNRVRFVSSSVKISFFYSSSVTMILYRQYSEIYRVYIWIHDYCC